MSNWLGKLLGIGDSSPEKMTNLENISKTGNNFETIPGDSQNPPHLIANGLITGSAEPSEIRTAISNVNGLEFSTVMGQVPNTSLGMAITDSLNHRLSGKFLTFDSEQQDKRDVVYATSVPSEIADIQAVKSELENHAKAKVLVSPILGAAQNFVQPTAQLDNQSVINMAKQIVAVNLDVQGRLIDGQSNQYLPTPKTSSSKFDPA